MKIKYTWATMGNDRFKYLEHAKDITASRDYYRNQLMPLLDTKEEAIAFLRKYCIDEKYSNYVYDYVLIEVYNFKDEVAAAIKRDEE